jgi:hypothetical protein
VCHLSSTQDKDGLAWRDSAIHIDLKIRPDIDEIFYVADRMEASFSKLVF